MFTQFAFTSFTLALTVYGQQVGTLLPEVHPILSWQKCTTAGGCAVAPSGKIVLDSNSRWIHATTSSASCYTGNTWDPTLCPDGTTCARNCALDGADYAGTYGITTTSNSLTLQYITVSGGTNIGSRVFLMANDTSYQLFKLLNQEFTFDVDVSNLPCGLKGAVYFSQMDSDGGIAKSPTNKAGAKFGTGYCDSRCPRNLKFINGVANSVDWIPNPADSNAGSGNFGSCCNEMDIWEANSKAAAFTPHPCVVSGQTRCEGDAQCGTTDRYSSDCDPDGCDFNSFRMGNQSFYGPGLNVDTTQTFTVITQFITNDGTATGVLSEIRRFYVQNGKVIPNSSVTIPGMSSTYTSITPRFCNDQKAAVGDQADFQVKGGLTAIGKALGAAMVLVFSISDDHFSNMLWLDSKYPTTSDPRAPGVARGTCDTTSGFALDVESNSATASVTFSNIKFGDIGSTFASQTEFGQCGGQGWIGPTVCAAGSTCTVANPFFSQCLPSPIICTGTDANAQCCATDVLGIADLDCAAPPTQPGTSIDDFTAICSRIGQRARCCLLPILGQALVCSAPVQVLLSHGENQ